MRLRLRLRLRLTWRFKLKFRKDWDTSSLLSRFYDAHISFSGLVTRRSTVFVRLYPSLLSSPSSIQSIAVPPFPHPPLQATSFVPPPSHPPLTTLPPSSTLPHPPPHHPQPKPQQTSSASSASTPQAAAQATGSPTEPQVPGLRFPRLGLLREKRMRMRGCLGDRRIAVFGNKEGGRRRGRLAASFLGDGDEEVRR